MTTLRVDDPGPVVHITLDGPGHLNAVDLELLVGLRRTLEELAADERVRVVVLTGEGRAFCAGANLAGVGEPSSVMDAAGALISTITGLDVPVVAAVNGPAVGYGASLVAAADLAVAADSAYVLLTFTAIGLVPDGGLTHTLPATVGRALAGEVALTGRRLSAEEALTAGLVSRVVPEADLPVTVRSLTDEIVSRPRRAVTLTKQALNARDVEPLGEALEREARAQVELLVSDEFAERTSRFRRDG